jgi:hypothetical protein
MKTKQEYLIGVQFPNKRSPRDFNRVLIAMQEYAEQFKREELIKFCEYFKEQATKVTDPNCSIDGDQYLLNWIPNIEDVNEYLNSK